MATVSYSLPDPHFYHKIIQAYGRYLIRSTCQECGEERAFVPDGSLQKWEISHHCRPVLTTQRWNTFNRA